MIKNMPWGTKITQHFSFKAILEMIFRFFNFVYHTKKMHGSNSWSHVLKRMEKNLTQLFWFALNATVKSENIAVSNRKQPMPPPSNTFCCAGSSLRFRAVSGNGLHYKQENRPKQKYWTDVHVQSLVELPYKVHCHYEYNDRDVLVFWSKWHVCHSMCVKLRAHVHVHRPFHKLGRFCAHIQEAWWFAMLQHSPWKNMQFYLYRPNLQLRFWCQLLEALFQYEKVHSAENAQPWNASLWQLKIGHSVYMSEGSSKARKKCATWLHFTNAMSNNS